MVKTNKKFIDKHWLLFAFRGTLAILFGCFTLFNGASNINEMIAAVSVLLLFMGIIDTVGALYGSVKKHGWINAIMDALIDIVAAILLLIFSNNDLTYCLVILSLYVIVSGVIDIFHGFLSTIDPTDRFIRILTGICGCVIGVVILNAGNFEITTFVRFFGTYMLIVGVTSLIYSVHNRAQILEDKAARSEHRKKSTKKSRK